MTNAQPIPVTSRHPLVSCPATRAPDDRLRGGRRRWRWAASAGRGRQARHRFHPLGAYGGAGTLGNSDDRPLPTSCCRSSSRCGTRRRTSSARSSPPGRSASGWSLDGVIGDYELIIVDDKSTDRTPEIADALGRRRPACPGHPPRGQPQARRIDQDRVRQSATGDLVLYSDADLPFDFEEVPRAIRLLRLYDADLVSAYRFDRTGEGYTRAIYTFFYNLLVRTMFGVKARDINFAFKLLPAPRARRRSSCAARGRSSTPS